VRAAWRPSKSYFCDWPIPIIYGHFRFFGKRSEEFIRSNEVTLFQYELHCDPFLTVFFRKEPQIWGYF